MKTTKRTIKARPIVSTKRKISVFIRNDEYYSNEDLKEIQEGFEQIKRGESVSHDDVKRLLGI